MDKISVARPQRTERQLEKRNVVIRQKSSCQITAKPNLSKSEYLCSVVKILYRIEESLF